MIQNNNKIDSPLRNSHKDTKTQSFIQMVLLKINLWCLRALVAIIFIVSG